MKYIILLGLLGLSMSAGVDMCNFIQGYGYGFQGDACGDAYKLACTEFFQACAEFVQLIELNYHAGFSMLGDLWGVGTGLWKSLSACNTWTLIVSFFEHVEEIIADFPNRMTYVKGHWNAFFNAFENSKYYDAGEQVGELWGDFILYPKVY